MRAIAGPAVALTIALGLLAYHALSPRDAPERAFTELELSLPGREGSCFSLSTTLIANGIFGKTPRTWKQAGDDSWQLTVESLAQGYAGPVREFSSWTFEKHGKEVELVGVEASPGRPQTPEASLTDLLAAPNARRSTPVDRCREPGASGYLYQRK